MKLLFVHEVGYLKKPIFEMHEFPELLAQRGHEITYLQFDEGRKFWQTNRPFDFEINGRTQVDVSLSIRTPFQLGIPGLDRLLATLTVFSKLETLFMNNKFDAVVLYAVPTFGWQTIQVAKRFNVPVLFRALDVSHKIRKSIFSPLIKTAEKFVYKNATILSANNPAMATYCDELSGRNLETLVQLPPLDLTHFKPATSRNSSLAQRFSISSSDKVIAYMGSFFYFSGLKQVLETFGKLPKSDLANTKLLLIGGGEQDAELRKITRDLGLQDKVVFTGFIDYKQLADYLSLADVAINPMIPGLVSNTAFPHKVLQYMALGIPTVSTRLQGLFSIFQESSGIVWVKNPRDTITSALNLINRNSDRKANKIQQLLAIEHMFKLGTAIDNFERTLKDLVD